MGLSSSDGLQGLKAASRLLEEENVPFFSFSRGFGFS